MAGFMRSSSSTRRVLGVISLVMASMAGFAAKAQSRQIFQSDWFGGAGRPSSSLLSSETGFDTATAHVIHDARRGELRIPHLVYVQGGKRLAVSPIRRSQSALSYYNLRNAGGTLPYPPPRCLESHFGLYRDTGTGKLSWLFHVSKNGLATDPCGGEIAATYTISPAGVATLTLLDDAGESTLTGFNHAWGNGSSDGHVITFANSEFSVKGTIDRVVGVNYHAMFIDPDGTTEQLSLSQLPSPQWTISASLSSRLESAVFDTGVDRDWGRIVADLSADSSTQVLFFLRAGSSEDDVRSRPWFGPVRSGEDLSSAALSNKRHLQYAVAVAFTDPASDSGSGYADPPPVVIRSIRVEFDTDDDGRIDTADNCPTVANFDQANVDGDTLGDACDGDNDNDGLPDSIEDTNSNGNLDPGETNRLDPDTDKDGLVDGWVDGNANNAFDPGEGEDKDRDGTVDADETDPLKADSDDGGVDDGQEAVDGTNPLDGQDDRTCGDDVKSGLETDEDCGGLTCPACAPSQMCNVPSDCVSKVCAGQGPARCAAPTCTDRVHNANETDVDCGGSACPTCSPGEQCTRNTDCASGVCDTAEVPPVCQAATCTDGIRNGDETDIDCGGTCGRCVDGQSCSSHTDCVTANCNAAGPICAPRCAEAADPADCDRDGLPNNREDRNGNGVLDQGETDPLDGDSDDDGIVDGVEDANQDGTVDDGETDPNKADSDGDGLLDGIEDRNGDGTLDGGETDPRRVDSDGDGLVDGWIDRDGDNAFDVGEGEDGDRDGAVDDGETDPTKADSDGDGLADSVELGFSIEGQPIFDPNTTDPLHADTDRDGLPDGLEDGNQAGTYDEGSETDPNQADTDHDGLPDGWVDANQDGRRTRAEGEDLDLDGNRDKDETDPRKADTDGGGESDGSEVLVSSHDPFDPHDDSADADGDGILNEIEDGNGNHKVDPGETDPTRADTDGDGLGDGVEDLNKNGTIDGGETDPTKADSDGDALADGIETGVGRDGKPFDNASRTNPLNPDSDSDGLSDGHEDSNANGIQDQGETSPALADSDSGGANDGDELSSGTDPLDPSDDRLAMDSDEDGLRDGIEDKNRNGVVDQGETNPFDRDSDGDGVYDGFEDANRNGAVDAGETDPTKADSDGDGETDGEELQRGSDPSKPDASFFGGGCSVTSNEDRQHLPSWPLLLVLTLLGLRQRHRAHRRTGSWRRSSLGLLSVALLTTTPSIAEAQVASFSLLRLRPAASSLGYYNTESGLTLPHLSPSVGLVLHYDQRPLQVVNPNTNERLYDEVSYQFNMQLLMAFGLWNRLELGLALPVTLNQGSGERGDPFPQQPSLSAGLGDLRLIPKLRLGTVGPFTVAVAVTVDIPTGGSDNYVGDGRVGAEPRGILALDWDRFGAAINVGVRFRPDRSFQFADSGQTVSVGNEFVSQAGARVGIVSHIMDLIADGYFALSLGQQDAEELSGEVLGGLRFYLPAGFSADVAAGPGLGRGVGTPTFRVLGGLRYQYEPKPTASLHIAAAADRDGDGVRDSIDQCPSTPEDRDGYEDTDGCPELDNDRDSIPDAEDKCPLVAEDVDSFEDEDGCPDLDNDGDGIADRSDHCPAKAEDMDGFEDEDGCPDLDNDQDGIIDASDRCPNKPETFNEIDDEDGCPDRSKGPVQIQHGKITVPPVYFASGRGMILRRSFAALQLVAAVLANNLWIKKVRIEGHTDNTGRAELNRNLSDQRAASVQRFLIERGINPGRLETQGLGPSRPIADNSTRAGRARNRRVEFVILDPPRSK